MPKAYTTKNAARRLGISVDRLYQLIADGRLKPSQKDPYIFFEADLDACKAVWPSPVGRKPGYKPAPITAATTISDNLQNS